MLLCVYRFWANAITYSLPWIAFAWLVIILVDSVSISHLDFLLHRSRNKVELCAFNRIAFSALAIGKYFPMDFLVRRRHPPPPPLSTWLKLILLVDSREPYTRVCFLCMHKAQWNMDIVCARSNWKMVRLSDSRFYFSWSLYLFATLSSFPFSSCLSAATISLAVDDIFFTAIATTDDAAAIVRNKFPGSMHCPLPFFSFYFSLLFSGFGRRTKGEPTNDEIPKCDNERKTINSNGENASLFCCFRFGEHTHTVECTRRREKGPPNPHSTHTQPKRRKKVK